MQVASAIESGVAQAAALASSISADELENRLQERKQSALPASLVASPSDSAGLSQHCHKCAIMLHMSVRCMKAAIPRRVTSPGTRDATWRQLRHTSNNPAWLVEHESMSTKTACIEMQCLCLTLINDWCRRPELSCREEGSHLCALPSFRRAGPPGCSRRSAGAKGGSAAGPSKQHSRILFRLC